MANKDIRYYDTTFRANYELYATGTWLICSGIAAVTPIITEAPSTVAYLAFSGVSLAMGLRRVKYGMDLYNTSKRLKGAELTFIDLEKLKPILKRYKENKSIWLGYGFEWENKHTQMVYEMSRRSKSEVIRGDRNLMKKGAAWLHGLNPSESEISQPIDHSRGHTLIVGTTGSGKTRMFDQLITQAIMRGDEAVIIVDPKGDKELCENARKACKNSGDENRFVYFHPAFPEKSARLDPLRNFNRATELASRIAVLMASEQGNPFQAFGQMSLNNICQGILMAGNRPNLVNVRSYLESGCDGLVVEAIAGYCDKVLPKWESLAAPYLSKANTLEKKAHALIRFYREKVEKKNPDLQGLFSMFEHDREHFQKMIASLLPIMNMLTAGDLGSLLSPDANDINDTRPITDAARIIRNNKVLYIGLDSLSDSMVGSAIGSITLSDLTAVAGDRYNYGLENNQVNLFVDETSEVVNLPLIQTLNKGRGAGYAATLATQTFADFAAALGDENKARQVLGNLNNIITLRVTDSETQKYICESIPKTRISYIMQTQGTGTASSSGEAHSGSIGERLMEEEVETISPSILGQLPDLEFFARLVDGRLMKGRIPILTS